MDFDITGITPEFLKSCKVDQLIDGFASACELYSAVLDINGRILIEPSGPNAYLGEFYVLMSDPKYYSLYQKITNFIIASGEPMYSEIDDGNPDSRLSAAPIFVDGRFVATWILYAHSKAQNQKLFKSFDKQGMIAGCLSDIISRLYVGSLTMSEDKEVRTELEFERQCKETVNEILDVIVDGDKRAVTDIYEKVGKLLDIDFMVYYKFDRSNPTNMDLTEYWAKCGRGEEAEKLFCWDNDHYSPEIAAKIKSDGLIIDKNSMTNQMRVEVFNGNVKAIMVFPIFIKGEYDGRMIFIENTKERVWTEPEITFARQITEIISKDLEVQLKLHDIEEGWKIIKDVAEAIPGYLFVRTPDGKIIFANSALKDKLGMDIVGKDSNFIVPMNDGYIDGAGVLQTSKGISVYQRYIDVLGGIYDVTESFHKWRTYDRVSIVILEPSKSEEL